MQLKRGWWKEVGGGYAFLVGEQDGRWYGANSKGASTSWDSNGISEFNNDDIEDNLVAYLGDGPEPVEPVQLCLGWWERRDGSTVEIKWQEPWLQYPWRDANNNGYMDNGHWSIDGGSPQKDIVKRRPDLDAKEALEQLAQPDPRDAEIAKLTMDNRSLTVRVDNQKSVIDRLTSRLSTIQTEYNNLARIIGDH